MSSYASHITWDIYFQVKKKTMFHVITIFVITNKWNISLFHIEFMNMFVIYLCTECCIPIPNGSLVIAMKPEAKQLIVYIYCRLHVIVSHNKKVITNLFYVFEDSLLFPVIWELRQVAAISLPPHHFTRTPCFLLLAIGVWVGWFMTMLVYRLYSIKL
jgi:hypothetical protein